MTSTLDLASVEAVDVPLELARRHWETAPGDLVAVTWSDVDRQRRTDLVTGAGFVADDPDCTSVRRIHSLPDTVDGRMRLLICGLNPSPAAADEGIGFHRPGNRFWPAACAAGLVTHDRDPLDALRTHGVGMSDLVKRTTRRADELAADEYRRGVLRLERLVSWLRPSLLCFVGLAGWRAAVDRRAVAGPQSPGLGATPVYVMPSTSGLNARTTLAELTDHLAAASELVSGGRGPSSPRARRGPRRA